MFELIDEVSEADGFVLQRQHRNWRPGHRGVIATEMDIILLSPLL